MIFLLLNSEIVKRLIMKKFLLLSLSLLFLNGCAQNVALLGPAYSIASTGNVSQALISQSVNSSVKYTTGKNVSEHVTSSLSQEIKDCNFTNNQKVQEIISKSFSALDCK
tara:strand:- start:113 stop:442 length:330 start_codon:yes stop_codon:yes gene_type:complete